MIIYFISRHPTMDLGEEEQSLLDKDQADMQKAPS